MAIRKTAYSGQNLVFAAADLDSLASSATWVAGFESAVIDNTTTLYLDALLTGRFKANNTAPTAGQIRIYVGCLLNDTEYPDVFDGTKSVETVTTVDIRDSVLKLAHVIVTDATINRIYEFSGISIASLFGGIMPPKWFVFVTHSMVQTLNVTASAGGQLWFNGITESIV
jgi:hypothetical protein